MRSIYERLNVFLNADHTRDLNRLNSDISIN